MKSLFLGIALIIVVGIGGLIYRNAVERPNRPVACRMDALVCPDGTAVGRTGPSCTFSACPPPNVSLVDVGIAFALLDGFSTAEILDSTGAAAYENKPTSVSTIADKIIIRRYAIAPTSTALATIQETAIGGASGEPVPSIAYSSTVIGSNRFTVVSIERFEAVIDTAYYLARSSDVLRFDAIDREVMNWTEPNLDVSKLPAHSALLGLLTTLQGE